QGNGRGMVDIHVELSTLAGLNENPGELRGYGPVIADVARQVAEDQSNAEHRVTVTEGGEPIWTGTTRRRPTTHQKRQVEARNPTCVFVGCRSTECDIDHTLAYSEGGPTEPDNLAPLCRHDHRLKHKAGWKLERAGPGTYQWTTPLGHSYTVEPEPP
ncbi:MAG TPA: HNH endonuclease signature motif containing protein, partial [Acidimicrobiia bacterium]